MRRWFFWLRRRKTQPLPIEKDTASDKLNTEIQELSGYDLDDVKVHYNSSRPAQLEDNSFNQGDQIQIEPEPEKHLPHEAWHVVQQKQARTQQENPDPPIERDDDLPQ